MRRDREAVLGRTNRAGDPTVGSEQATSDLARFEVDGGAVPRPPVRRTRRIQPDVLFAIAAGGALGTPARYGLAQLVRAAPGSYPWATFAVNMTGSFALGLILIVVLERFPPTRYARPFLGTGFLGAYTTYSTFAVETDLLVRDGHAGIAIAYAVASLIAGLAAVWGGMRCGRALPLPKRGGTP